MYHTRKRRTRRGSSSSGPQRSEDESIHSDPSTHAEEQETEPEQGGPSHTPPVPLPIRYGPAPEHRDRYNLLSQFKMAATRFPAMRPLSNMNLTDILTRLFDNIGWGSLLTLKYHTWQGPTLEFLSSVKRLIGNGPERLVFRYAGQTFIVPYERIALAFEAPYPCDYDSSQRKDYHQDYDPEAFWKAITHAHDYDPQHLKQSLITHPALRIAARIISSTVMGRGETGPLLLKELYILWCMTHPRKATVCLVSFLAQRLLLNKQPATICLGGMISFIIDRCIEQPLPPDSAALPGHIMDRAALQNYQIIAKGAIDPPYTYLVQQKTWCTLPQERVSTFPSIDADWYFPPDEDVENFPEDIFDDGQRGVYVAVHPYPPREEDEPHGGAPSYQYYYPHHPGFDPTSMMTAIDTLSSEVRSLRTDMQSNFTDLFSFFDPRHESPYWQRQPPPQ